MNITIITATQNPLDAISLAAGTCYGKTDISHKRVKNCYKLGHLSVFEHASSTVRIEGISRACSHQLVRHRLASFCQESQRYCKYDFEGSDWYVMPPDTEGLYGCYEESMRCAADDYRRALGEGVKPEDARYLLPEATKTNLVMTMNCRELFHFLDMRTDKAAQWEIRDMANKLKDKLQAYDSQWKQLIELWECE